MRLHSYWRSAAAYRVRIALALKGLSFELSTVDLRAGAHRLAAYRTFNPQGLVPALEVEGGTLLQSLPIIEWLEESFPSPPLLPTDPLERARVRAMAAVIACDIHPLNNLRVLQRLRGPLAAPEAVVTNWIAAWIAEGFLALETLLPEKGWSHGDHPGLADCCVVPQVYSANRFGVDLAAFPNVRRIARMANDHPAFAAAHPDRQPGADASGA